ncbi:MAG: TetR/AcrR family transcriptional regulator [Cellvibrionaceae bacterium]
MPKIVDHKKRQQEIASAAFVTVSKLGIASTTMRAVAEKANCTTGAILHYFKSKDDILIAALNFSHERTAVRMRALIKVDAPHLIYHLCAEALPLEGEHKEEWRVWMEFWGHAIRHPDLQKINKQRYRHWLSGIKMALQKGIERSELKKNLTVSQETLAIAALIDGLGIQAMLDPKRLPSNVQLNIIKQHLNRLQA